MVPKWSCGGGPIKYFKYIKQMYLNQCLLVGEYFPLNQVFESCNDENR